MKIIKPHLRTTEELEKLDNVIIELSWFNKDIKGKNGHIYPNPDYSKLFGPEGLLNPESPNSILNTDELYLVWGMKPLFDYIRALGNKDPKYNIGDSRYYYNSACDTSLLTITYCNTARFIFLVPTDLKIDWKIEQILAGNIPEPPQIGECRYVDLTMAKSYFDYYSSLIDGGYVSKLGFDFETNGMPFREDFKITGFSLSCDQLSTWFDYRYPLDASDEVKKEAYDALKNFMDKYQRRCWAYNVQFEMSVMYHLFTEKYEFQDSRAVLVCDGYNWGSLKLNAQKQLNIRAWKDEEDNHRGLSSHLFKYFGTYDKFVEWCNNPESDLHKSPKEEWIKKIYEELVSLDTDWNLYKDNWGYDWACIPTKILGKYCCLDSFYTVKIAEKLLPKYLVAYPTFINNARLAFELGLGGIRMNYDHFKAAEKGMTEMMNACRIYLDQFTLQCRIWEYEAKVKDYHFTENFMDGVNRFGPSIINGAFNRVFIQCFSNNGIVTFDEDKAIEILNGDLEAVENLKKAIAPADGWMNFKQLFRKRGIMDSIATIIEKHYQIKENIFEYNKKHNLTSDFYQVREYLNSYREITAEKAFGDFKRFINWDMNVYKNLYEYALKLDIVDKEACEIAKKYLLCDNAVEAKYIIESIRVNKLKVDFHKRITIPGEHDWDYEPSFFSKIALALRTEHSQKEELNKIFVNFSDIINLISNRNELKKYEDIEDIGLFDRPEYITFNGQKVKWMGFGGRVANFNAPSAKEYLGWSIHQHYKNELTYTYMNSPRWIEYDGILPIPTEESNIERDESGKIIKVKVRCNSYEDHVNLRKISKNYKEMSESFDFSYGIKDLCQGVLASMLRFVNYDKKDYKLKLSDHKTKLEQIITLTHLYMFQAGCAKEYHGYIIGAQQGMYNRMIGISKVQGRAEIKASKKEDIKYWSYFPSWMVNEKVTKRWSSGFHTFVPHSDSMSCFEVSREPGDEEVAIYFDINGAEIRSIAYTSEDEAAMSIFEAGKDFYLEVVKSAYPDASESFWKMMRGSWKSAVLGIFYGIGDQAVSNMHEIPLDQVAFIRSTLMDKLINIKKVIKASVEHCSKTGEVLTVLGDRTYAESYRAATVGFNTRIQGFSAVALADAFYNNVTCLNKCGYDTKIRIVVHDSNTIVVKIKDLFKVIYGIEKYYKMYFRHVYKMMYKYDLVLHINLRDSIGFKYDMENRICSLEVNDKYGEYLYDTICKYYKVELIEKTHEEVDELSTENIVEKFKSKSHKYHCGEDYKLPSKWTYKFKILNPIEELTEMVNKVNYNAPFYKDRNEETLLKPTWRIDD